MGGPTKKRLLVFDTHPIQYRAPVFKAIAAKLPDFQVCFFDRDFNGARWWFREIGTAYALPWDASRTEGYPNQILGLGKLGPVKRVTALARAIRAFGPTAVVVYGYYLPEHWIVRWLCARLGITVYFVGETFSDYGSGWRAWLKKPLLRLFFSGDYRCVAIGEKNRAYYRARGIPANRLVTAKYCVDTSFFSLALTEANAMREAWRREHSLPPDSFVMLFVGRLFDRKRPFDLLKLQESLPASPAVYTVLAGGGPLEADLRERSRGNHRLRILGFQDPTQVRNAYYGADVLVIPSEFETWGLVANEAAACGLPIVATDRCGVAGDLVLDGETGYTFPVGNLEVAREHIVALVTNPELRESLGAAARKKVTAEYGVERFAEAVLRADEVR